MLLLLPYFAVLAAVTPLVSSSNVQGRLSPSLAPSLLHPHVFMDSLSTELLAIAASHASGASLVTRENDLSQAIEKNASSLDAIGIKGAEDSLSDDTRIGLACKASQLIFGSRAVMPEDPLYKEEQQENWFVILCEHLTLLTYAEVNDLLAARILLHPSSIIPRCGRCIAPRHYTEEQIRRTWQWPQRESRFQQHRPLRNLDRHGWY